ncbi:serine/threonine protein kinase [Pseudomonas daroniae]|uniref:non-specific serine/threonine protein kinase n=2 Tax=Pseudomonadales TaxID=72274 RepID=A0A4Q9QL79_9GAMM|nr:serine/threonine protein kinase [Pseudomonas daroniae]TBU82576.1 serine/threonine protein kinase [Pseudomonas sp. FRB 228]TBU91711.1 serine/threonine protein kinase [Pseudomonas daroniae]
MQEVYYCRDHSLDRYTALKTPKAGVKDRRFRRGAEMGARVNHPNIAATLDYYENDNLTFLVEEFIPGLDLGHRLANEFFFLDPYLAAHVSHHIAKALREAHRVGICHRDLKPSNIMTSADPSMEFIKLTDFGIAKLAETEIAAEMELFAENESTLLTSNTLLGAVPYMAPECWDDWKTAGMPMDVWALGCVIYHLLAGTPPFGTGRLAIANVLKYQAGAYSLSKPTWFGKHPDTNELQQNIWSVLVSCLAPDPNARPTAEEVMIHFNAFTYATSPRRVGKISQYPMVYPDGGKAAAGFIRENGDNESRFFHHSNFYGASTPSAGQNVCFSSYPGVPNPRSSPILLLR